MIAVVDSSVVIKWFVPEVHADLALDLRFQSLAAPDILIAECANVFWKKTRRGETAVEDARLALLAIDHADIYMVPSRSLSTRAFEISQALDHPAYDCFYLALCERLALPLITADDKLQRKVLASSSTSARILEIGEWKHALNDH